MIVGVIEKVHFVIHTCELCPFAKIFGSVICTWKRQLDSMVLRNLLQELQHYGTP